MQSGWHGFSGLTPLGKHTHTHTRSWKIGVYIYILAGILCLLNTLLHTRHFVRSWKHRENFMKEKKIPLCGEIQDCNFFRMIKNQDSSHFFFHIIHVPHL